MRNLPPSKINGAEIENSLTSEGCVITKAKLKHSVIGVRSVIENGSELNGVITMGSDFYETEDTKKKNEEIYTIFEIFLAKLESMLFVDKSYYVKNRRNEKILVQLFNNMLVY